MTSQALINAARRRKATKGRRGLMRRAPAVQDPKGIARKYRAELRAFVMEFQGEVRKTLIERLPRLAQQRDASMGNLDAWDEDVEQLIEALTVFGRRRAGNVIRGIEQRAEKISTWNREQYMRSIRAVIGVDLFGGVDGEGLQVAMRSWARENATLIRDIPDKMMKDIEGIAQRGLRSGSGPKAIAKQIRTTMEATENRAKLIARDQVSKLNGQLTKQRNESLGVERYIWMTSTDERVRASHRAMHNKLCRWDDDSVYSDDGGETWKSRASIGGYIGHPGSDYQCRCVSAADLSDVLSEMEAAAA